MSGSKRNPPLKPIADDHDFRPKTPFKEGKQQHLVNSKTQKEESVRLSPESANRERLFHPQQPKQDLLKQNKDMKVEDYNTPPSTSETQTPKTPRKKL